MQSFQVTVPFLIDRVTVRRRMAGGEEAEVAPTETDAAAPAPVQAEQEDQLLYDGAYDAGFRDGRRKALEEIAAARAAESREVKELLRELNGVFPQLIKLAEAQFPDLMLTALGRVFREHRFTMEEMANEVGALLAEVTQAQTILIEGNPADIGPLQGRIEKLGLSFHQGRVQWKANPTLERNEYVIQTDLGMIDGRRLTKLTQIQGGLGGLGS